MRLPTIACCAALMLGLLPLTAAAACDGTECRAAAQSKAPGKPLELGRFLRPSRAKHAHRSQASKTSSGRHKHAVASRHRKHTAARAVVAKPAPIPVEAAAAYASQPSAQVRVVAHDQINEIDLAADAARAMPLRETSDAGPHAGHAVQVVDTTQYNDIDRMSDSARLAMAAAEPRPADATPRDDQAGLSWAERIWSMLQAAVLALVIALRNLAG